MPPTDPPEIPPLSLNGRDLTVADVISVARGDREVRLAPEAADRMRASREVVERVVAEHRTVYGVTTGFGDLADVRIEPEQTAELQHNLVRSHAAGVGPPLPTDVVRAMLLLRANALAVGLSGVRVALPELLLDLLNARIHPVIPSRGSVGASGDLAPLAHLALVVIGEGEAELEGQRMPGSEALAAAGLEPLELEAKEGLALLNGTQLMAAIGALAIADARSLAETADVIGAMSLEAMEGTGAAFADALVAARPHPGQRASAARLRAMLAESEIGEAHRDLAHRVQDAYSLRCMPQVHGAVRDAVDQLERVVDIELNAATDNPLVFAATDDRPEGEVISGGNFHGEPLALVLDYAKAAVVELASISERRTARLVDARFSGLPPVLSEHPGVQSGLMITQYTAAALVNEAKSLAHPASVDSIPTGANQEDHVSMGATAALHLLEVLDRARTVLAIEALCAAQGLDFRSPMRPGAGVARAHTRVRRSVDHLAEDRSPAPDIAVLHELVASGELLAAADGDTDG
ncbi:MAG TPA: histidine ammonia-lyase [Candidatus Limnocylindria bacterium]|nr:histidine ammonia-lyase [Candidatus Limnocylindria bacterium]